MPYGQASGDVYDSRKNSGLAIACLVLAILGFLSGIFFVGIALDVLAVILGIIALIQNNKKKGLPVAGMIAVSYTHLKITDILRDAYYTYEFKKTADLMIEMREKRFNVAFVLNEYGSCVGMITLEDLLEEIVGEIRDEYDADEDELIQEIGERQYLVEGGMKLDDINDALGTELESEDYDSILSLIHICSK